MTPLEMQITLASLCFIVLLTLCVCWAISVAASRVVGAVGYACSRIVSGSMDARRDMRKMQDTLGAICPVKDKLDRTKQAEGTAPHNG
jgi:hypothetical protein